MGVSWWTIGQQDIRDQVQLWWSQPAQYMLLTMSQRIMHCTANSTLHMLLTMSQRSVGLNWIMQNAFCISSFILTITSDTVTAKLVSFVIKHTAHCRCILHIANAHCTAFNTHHTHRKKHILVLQSPMQKCNPGMKQCNTRGSTLCTIQVALYYIAHCTQHCAVDSMLKRQLLSTR